MLRFAGRSEQLDSLAQLFADPDHAPIIVTGPARIGRTSLLREALRTAPAGTTVLADDFGLGGPELARRGIDTIPVTAQAVRRAVRLRPAPIFVLDDAHQAPHSVVRALSEAHHAAGARLLLSRPDGVQRLPDPLDCLQYEAGVRFLSLAPLTLHDVNTALSDVCDSPVHPMSVAALHAATAGVPGQLSDLVAGEDLFAAVGTEPALRIRPDLDRPLTLGATSRRMLLEAVHAAWMSLSVQRLMELCVLALRAGAVAEVAPMWAFVTLLQGRPEDGLAVLDGLAPSPRLVLYRALLLALGLNRIEEADEFLLDAGLGLGAAGRQPLAMRAFLAAALGRPAPPGAHADVRHEPGPEAFLRAATGIEALSNGRPREAVPHLRRAIITATALGAEVPWLRPYLTGSLIDALLLSGRISEATEISMSFHAAREGCGWDVAVSLSTLFGNVAKREAVHDMA